MVRLKAASDWEDKYQEIEFTFQYGKIKRQMHLLNKHL